MYASGGTGKKLKFLKCRQDFEHNKCCALNLQNDLEKPEHIDAILTPKIPGSSLQFRFQKKVLGKFLPTAYIEERTEIMMPVGAGKFSSKNCKSRNLTKINWFDKKSKIIF
jgi:hypothetical protein